MFHYARAINKYFLNIREYKELYILLLADKSRKNVFFNIYRKRKFDYHKNNCLMIKVVEQHDYNQHRNPIRLFFIIQILSRVMGSFNHFLSNTVLVNFFLENELVFSCFFVFVFVFWSLKKISCPGYLSEGSLDSSASLPNSQR